MLQSNWSRGALNYWASALDPGSHNYRGHHPMPCFTTGEATALRSPQVQLENGTHSLQLGKGLLVAMKTQHSPKQWIDNTVEVLGIWWVGPLITWWSPRTARWQQQHNLHFAASQCYFCFLGGRKSPLIWSWLSRKVKGKSLSRARFLTTPWTVAHQTPPSMGFSRQEYWSGVPFPSPGDLPDPGIKPRSPAL